MCRLLAYLGPPLALERLISEPEHSLLLQSYDPKEMTAGTVNADGFGFAWYDRARQDDPFVYRNVLPIWSDVNLGSLGRYVVSDCILANVRSATPGQSLALDNTQPFSRGPISALHNGFVDDFRLTLYRPLRDRLDDEAYASIAGNTDSEHLLAWLFPYVAKGPTLAAGLRRGLEALIELAPEVRMGLNFVVGDGRGLAASRLAQGAEAPSLYCLAGHARFPDAVLLASEPLFEDDGWSRCPESSIIAVDGGGTVSVDAFPG